MAGDPACGKRVSHNRAIGAEHGGQTVTADASRKAGGREAALALSPCGRGPARGVRSKACGPAPSQLRLGSKRPSLRISPTRGESCLTAFRIKPRRCSRPKVGGKLPYLYSMVTLPSIAVRLDFSRLPLPTFTMILPSPTQRAVTLSGLAAPETIASALDGVHGPSERAPTQINWSPLATSVATCIKESCMTLSTVGAILSVVGTILSQPQRSEADANKASFTTLSLIIREIYYLRDGSNWVVCRPTAFAPHEAETAKPLTVSQRATL
jgi:hypothetical protein